MSQHTFVRQAIGKAAKGEHLSREEARGVMTEIMEGIATPAQIGSLLTALQIKGETLQEIIGFAEAMRSKSVPVNICNSNLLDTCGTGGDGARTFNISTTAAIVAAAGGVQVAKHGNRAMSSKSGSADVLEALGVGIDLSGEQVKACLEQIGICFMFAQSFHPSMKYAAAPRRELGIRTVFNLLGPLTNPAGADCQVLGVFDRSKTELLAQALQALGLKRALVVASEDGLDEFSVSAPTQVTELREGEITTYKIKPDDLGLRAHRLEDIAGGDASFNAELIRQVFAGEKGAHRDIVLANAAACFYVAGHAGSLQQGVKLAADVIDDGRAERKLNELIQFTGGFIYVS